MKPLNKIEKYAVAQVIETNREPDSFEWERYLDEYDARMHDLRKIVWKILNYEAPE